MKRKKMKKSYFIGMIMSLFSINIVLGRNAEQVDKADPELQLKYIQSSIIEKWLLADKTIKELQKIDMKELDSRKKRYIKNLVASYNTTINEENQVSSSIQEFLNHKEIKDNKNIDKSSIGKLAKELE